MLNGQKIVILQQHHGMKTRDGSLGSFLKPFFRDFRQILLEFLEWPPLRNGCKILFLTFTRKNIFESGPKTLSNEPQIVVVVVVLSIRNQRTTAKESKEKEMNDHFQRN